MLQRGKRAEGPEGSPKPQNGSGLGVQSCPRGHSSLQTPNLSWAGVSSHKHCRLCSSQPRAAGPSAIPGHPCPTVSHNVPHVSPMQSLAPAHAEPQHRARGNQTHPLLEKASGDPSPPQPPCRWGSGGMDGHTWMSHSWRVMGSEGRAAMQWRRDGWLEWVRGRRKHFLTSQPSEIRANVQGGANPVRLCRKWQSPGRHPPGEDTRGYVPHTCHRARGAGTDGELGKGH